MLFRWKAPLNAAVKFVFNTAARLLSLKSPILALLSSASLAHWIFLKLSSSNLLPLTLVSFPSSGTLSKRLNAIPPRFSIPPSLLPYYVKQLFPLPFWKGSAPSKKQKKKLPSQNLLHYSLNSSSFPNAGSSGKEQIKTFSP